MKRTISALLVGVSTIASTAALAQDAPPKAATNGSTLQDIIVTAQRRAENVINVPLSIQAITGNTLKNENIQKFDQLNFTTPGFIVQSGTGYTEAYIRGVGNAVLVGADPSVTVNVDDVPHVYGSLISDFVNVERVEVLKGAQGGLYGRNATGGVVNIITRQPSDKLAFDGTTSYGSFQTWDVSAYLNVPITDKIEWNVSASRYTHDGYVKNVAPNNPYVNNFAGDGTFPADGSGTGLAFLNPGSPGQQPGPSQLNNQKVWSVDTKLKLLPTDNLKITLGWDYTEKKDAGGNGWQTSDAGYHGPNNLPTGSTNDTVPGASSLTGAALTYDYYMHLLLGAAGYNANINQIHHIESLFQPLGKWESYGAYLAYAPTRDYGASARAVWSLPGVDITNITAYRWNESRFQGDIGAGPVPMAGFQVHVTRHYLYQEDRAQTTTSGPLQLLAGATYFTDKINNSIAGQFLGFTQPATLNFEKTTSWSVYGQASYDFTDRIKLTGSLRYIHEKRQATFPADPADLVFTGVEQTSGTEHKLVPAVTLSYKTDAGTIYARWARGFKTGGVNPLVRPSRYLYGCPTCQANTTFGGETVDTYEIGWRTNLFNHRAQLTTAVFYNDYKGLQVAVGGNKNNPDVSLTYINAKSARTYGAEASLTVKVAPPLTISGNIGYLNAKYTNFSFPGNFVVDAFNNSGNRMALSPMWQGGVSANLDQPITDRLHIIGTVLASYTGKFYYSASDDPETSQKGYWNVNMRVGVRSADQHYGIFLDIENLFDEHYYVFGASYANPTNNVPIYHSIRADNNPGTPRVLKATVELKF